MTEGARGRRENSEHQIRTANGGDLQPSDWKRWKRLLMPSVGWEEENGQLHCCRKGRILVETFCRKILTGCIKAFKKIVGFDLAIPF